MRRVVLIPGLILGLILGLPAAPAGAQQAETLADIRQDLTVLTVELQRLRQELNTTGSSGVAVAGSQLDRITAIEAELQRVTAKTEQLEFRLDRIVQDGANRIGDLQFRLCELEPGCDIATIGKSDPLGGEAVAAAPAPEPQPGTDALSFDGELAVSEEADFRAAQDALAAGDFAGAAQLFALFRETYPQGPLDPAALIGEGRALEGLGDLREAARRFLAAYSGYPDARVAPEALWRLGEGLAALGSVPEACVTLGEVARRYPGSDFVGPASDSRAALGCE